MDMQQVTAGAPVAHDAMIQVRGLCKRYRTAAGEVDALKGVDWQIGHGEAVVLMGPSGCGTAAGG